MAVYGFIKTDCRCSPKNSRNSEAVERTSLYLDVTVGSKKVAQMVDGLQIN